jgi:disulfide bond formation protein DsbB
MTLSDLPPRPWPAYALAASLSLLAAAHGFQHFGGLDPCPLCLRQREAHWIAAGVAATALVLQAWRPSPIAARAFAALLAVSFLASAAVAGFHVGVEFKWWPGLAECGGGGPIDAGADLLGALTRPAAPAGCDTVAWSFLGLSMAAWNMLASLGLFLLSALAAKRAAPPTTEGREAHV